MAGVVVVSHPRCRDHDPGPEHPESAARLDAVRAALEWRELVPYLDHVPARPATLEELTRVHRLEYVEAVRGLSEAGGGLLDVETVVSPATWEAACLAAGAGLVAVDRLASSTADSAFVSVRPPGHHAHADRGTGFCVFNNLAVTAAALLARGERVLVVDWDVHYGHGTQDILRDEPRALLVSLHQGPGLYPDVSERSRAPGPRRAGFVNFPFPPGATGGVFLRALDEVVAPLAEAFSPSYVLVSAGFDAHRDDPYADLSLTSGDFALLAERVRAFAPAPGRLVLFLEGGYDLPALRRSIGATVAALAGVPAADEPASSGGPGDEVVDEVLASLTQDGSER